MDIAVLSVLCKVALPNLESVMRVVLMEMKQEGNRYWEQIEKFGDAEAFWRLMERYYGFDREKT